MDISKITIKTEKIDGPAGCWNSAMVEIFYDGTKIGEYTRNYHSYAEQTFHPFEQGGKFYALYSKDYVATRVMELPSCKDICGEDINSYGFCPTDYFVPKEANGKFGFVCGCIWGDDCSWKIQYLDLSKITEGIFVRDDRFGYLELPNNISLEQAIDVDDEDYIKITSFENYNISGTKDDVIFERISQAIYPGESTIKLIKYLDKNFCAECGFYKKPRVKDCDDPFACKCIVNGEQGVAQSG